MKVMNTLDPLGKKGVLLLQSMSNEGKSDVVDQYEKMFVKEFDEA